MGWRGFAVGRGKVVSDPGFGDVVVDGIKFDWIQLPKRSVLSCVRRSSRSQPVIRSLLPFHHGIITGECEN
jgi:hypothetical protein